MEIATVKEVCVCGAAFETTGNTAHCAFRYKDFLDAHAVCRENVKNKTENAKQERMPMIDYQTFTDKSTPMNERRQLGIGDIFSNTATCLICGETIRSKNRHDRRTCKCGNLSIDGGSWYPKRLFTKGESSYKDTVEYYDEVEE